MSTNQPAFKKSISSVTCSTCRINSLLLSPAMGNGGNQRVLSALLVVVVSGIAYVTHSILNTPVTQTRIVDLSAQPKMAVGADLIASKFSFPEYGSDGIGIPLSQTHDSYHRALSIKAQKQIFSFGFFKRSHSPELPDPHVTFGLFSRFHSLELPYAKSFITYYEMLGVRSFYFITNDVLGFSTIDNFLRNEVTTTSGKIVGYQLRLLVGQADTLVIRKDLLNNVTEDYLIGVDMDEYWVLSEYDNSLLRLVEQKERDVYIAPWVFVVFDGLEESTSPPYYGTLGFESRSKSNRGKWMARTKYIAFPGLHAPGLKKIAHHTISKKSDVGSLVHFMSRSFWDTAMKDLASNVDYTFGLKSVGAATDLTPIIDKHGTLPSRMRYLSYMAGCPKIVRVDSPQNMDMLNVDRDLEKKMAERVINIQGTEMQHFMRELHDKYMRFKTCLEPYRPKKLLLMRNHSDEWMRSTPCGENITEKKVKGLEYWHKKKNSGNKRSHKIKIPA